jgi:hypothetical protein
MMSTANSWYVQAPGLILAAISYLLIARLALDLVFGNRVRLVGAITPRVVPGVLVTACAVVWIFAARIALIQVLAAMSMRRMLG